MLYFPNQTSVKTKQLYVTQITNLYTTYVVQIINVTT